MSPVAPLRILIAAMGGEGGGVLAAWITEAAVASGFAAQRTSIPGVAQRTGATTYYLEILSESGGARPILALNPAPGRVDVVLATELLEAARMVQAGYVTPDRTLIIAATHRVYTVAEKSGMADGRLDSERLFELVRRFARRAVLVDFAAIAAEVKAPLNAVLLGALAASGATAATVEAFRAAIGAGGKAVEANLRGFDAGLRLTEAAPVTGTVQPGARAGAVETLDEEARRMLPTEAAGFAAEGARRLVDYQDAAYARCYLARLARFVGRPGADASFLRELARHLAVRMSVEDTIRVAQLKLRDARLARLRSEARAAERDVIHVTEFFRPGPEEVLGTLPAAVARPLLRGLYRLGWTGWSLPMRIRTTSLGGQLRLRFLAALRRWRPVSLRFAEEEAWIERWLSLVDGSLAVDTAAAREVVETAGLVKGYSGTYKRGLANWTAIAVDVIEPMLDGRLPRAQFADAVLQARLAALSDPEGDRLRAVIASIQRLGAAPPEAAPVASRPERAVAAE